MILMGFIVSLTTFAESAHVFVSFSMPETFLIETLRDSARLNIPATLNGLYQNSVEKTAQKIMVLSKEVPQLQLQIDPTAFERFHIKQVPALVVSQGDCFDVIYGNLFLNEGLRRIREKGECSKRGPL
jgi:conjugal transfer pilus assembly protein TrbC